MQAERTSTLTPTFADGDSRGREGLAPKPRNLWRRIQIRRRLGYRHWR